MTQETDGTRGPDQPTTSGADGRDETPAERLDRNWDELLQELRVTQTGVQILFAFLLVLPFQARFDQLDAVERWLYVVVLALVAVSTILNLAPVITHRFLFAQHKKDVLLRVAALQAKWSFAALGLALVGAVALAVDTVSGRRVGGLIAGGVALLIVVLWAVVPSVLLARHGDDPTY